MCGGRLSSSGRDYGEVHPVDRERVSGTTPTHPLDPVRRRAEPEAAAPIVIEENAWLAGVTIGADGVVGAGAVVTEDIPRTWSPWATPPAWSAP
ncbi:hypothetical protein EDD29_3320 [Actinocorallia herbida]|uniref:Uncharacterized protein n=1 Tax=Actinocorallia herbida TaxID=58109 RepID=A0A3N1CWV1_9ACTN|nr:hypothetical protein EDD29_3320 [Actinocorallia herbida]